MKRMLTAAIMILMAILCLQQGAAAEEWPLAILWPAGNFATQGTMDLARLVKERSGGKLNIVVHPGGALGYKGPEMLRVVKDGLVPIGEMLLGYVAGAEPILDLSTMPFLVSDFKEAHQLGTISRPTMEKAFTKWNQKLLYWHFWPGAGIFTKKPVQSIDDLKDLRIRAFNAESTEWVKAAGGKPLTMPWGDVYMALFTGGIDAVLTSSVSGVDGKFWEVDAPFREPGVHLRLQRRDGQPRCLEQAARRDEIDADRDRQGDGGPAGDQGHRRGPECAGRIEEARHQGQ